MTNSRPIGEYVSEYFQSRPNLAITHKPLCVFFLACSGSGKSTLRNLLVDQLEFTYVCNDEVRKLSNLQAGESRLDGFEIKDVMSGTWDKIMTVSANKAVVFDCNIISYYMHDDSYLNVAKRLGVPVFIIRIDVPEPLLKQRILSRGIDNDQILGALPGQLDDYRKAASDLVPDFTIDGNTGQEQFGELLSQLKTH